MLFKMYYIFPFPYSVQPTKGHVCLVAKVTTQSEQSARCLYEEPYSYLLSI